MGMNLATWITAIYPIHHAYDLSNPEHPENVIDFDVPQPRVDLPFYRLQKNKFSKTVLKKFSIRLYTVHTPR